MSYNDTYSQLESPEKVNSLERNKYQQNLLQDANAVDYAVYGGTNNYGQTPGYMSADYSSYAKNAPTYAPQATYTPQATYASQPTYAPQPTYAQNQYGSIYNTEQYTPYSSKTNEAPPYSTVGPQYSTPSKSFTSATSNTTPKPFNSNTTSSSHYEKSYDYGTTNQFSGADRSKYDNVPSSGSYTKFDTSSNLFNTSATDFKVPSDGYKTSEYNTSTYKIPGGTQTDTYRYESYHSSSEPVCSTTTEKYYTSTPNSKVQFMPIDKKGFEPFSKNGSDHQSSFSSNVEYISKPPTLKDTDTLEQKMLKKSVTQQVIEKKTVSTTKSTKQESSTKNFRLE